MKLALRSLLHSPGFTAVAVLTLALGLGVNTAVFAFVRDMLLHPLAQHARRNLVSVYTKRIGPNQDYRRFTYAEFTTLRESREVFADLTAFSLEWSAIGNAGEFKRSLVTFVPENYFATFGIQPHAGRFFTAAEARPGSGAEVVVANHTFWKRMGGRADFVGSQLKINQRTFTVVGIAPQGFGGVHASIGPDVWLPFGALQPLYGTDLLQPRTSDLYILGSLQPDLSLEGARSKSDVLAARLNALQPGEDPRTLMLTRPPAFGLGNYRPENEGFLGLFATLTMALAAAVLLVACLNLANMMLARGTQRRKEIAIRLSLGASRGRVVRQLLAEGLLLAFAGAGVGLLLSVWSSDAMLSWALAAFAAGPFLMTIQPTIDASLLIASFALSVLATLVFSLVPALRVTRINLVEDLKRQSGAATNTDRWNRFFSLRHLLLMAQVALSLMLLFCAGLFVRGSHSAGDRDPGFSTEGQVVANIDYSFAGLDRTEINRRQNALLEQARRFPGVDSAALASAVPFNFELSYRPVFVAGRPQIENGTAASAPRASQTAVSQGYFATLKIPLLRGRDFTPAESSDPNSRPVAIIDEIFARILFPNTDALGRHIVLNAADATGQPDREIEIIGIIRSPEDEVFAEAAPPRLYRPLAQSAEKNIYVHLRASSPAAETAVSARARRELSQLDRATPLLSVRPLADFLQKNINLLLVKLAATAFSVFGLVAVALAVVGVYGLKAYAVAQRTHEIGIRISLGAQSADVIKLIVGQAAAQMAIAATAGIALALLAGQALSKMLYRVEPFDPLLLGAATLVIAIAALLAAWLPARRATKVDPLVALRAE